MGVNAQTAVPAFTAGQVLTAAQMTQVNTGIPVFATTVTRDAAFSGSGEKVLAQGQYAYIEATSSLMVYSGSAWVSAGTQIAIFNETQASGTNAGTFTSGSYVKRVLNTTVINQITSCTLTSSVISLPAGSYLVNAVAPGYKTNQHKIKLRNTTDATDIQIGSSEQSDSGTFTQTISTLNAFFVLTATKNIELQHRCNTTRTNDGLGTNSAFGDSEIYAQITITKVA